jgi:hypothetical protein
MAHSDKRVAQDPPQSTGAGTRPADPIQTRGRRPHLGEPAVREDFERDSFISTPFVSVSVPGGP